MNNFYYSVHGQPHQGPVTKEEFLRLNLPADTMVWFEGQAEWQKAGDVPGLLGYVPQLIPPSTPVIPPSTAGFNQQPINPTPLVQQYQYANPVNAQGNNKKYILYGVGGLVTLFLFVKLFGGGSHDPKRQPYVETYSSNFAAKLMKATYPFTGRNPKYEVVDWDYDDDLYTIEMKTYWDGSCTIFDGACNVGYTVKLQVTENGTFKDYKITDRNDCANQHRICDIAIGAVMQSLGGESLQ